jgi:acetyl-CoA carboxylase carboxyltransferase component
MNLMETIKSDMQAAMKAKSARELAVLRMLLAAVKNRQVELKTRDELSDEQAAAFQQPILDTYAQESSASYSTARLWDDGVIDPHDTRMVLALGLAAALHAPWPERRQSVYRM